jgi:ATP-binding cassette subfamily C protein
VLLVDEATAALDAKTSKSVVDSILAIEDITKVVITHKLDESELSKYDSIIVLKNGNVVEEGSFDNLIEDKKYFYSLYNVNRDVA